MLKSGYSAHHVGVQTCLEAESSDAKYQSAKVDLKQLQDVLSPWLSLQSHLYATLCLAGLPLSLRIAIRQFMNDSDQQEFLPAL